MEGGGRVTSDEHR